MNIKVYTDIIKRRNLNPGQLKANGFREDEYQFQKDLLLNKTAWTGNLCQDWICYMKLYHPLISIIFVPKEHPFTQKGVTYIFISNLFNSLKNQYKKQ